MAPAVQSTYNETLEPAVNGQIANSEPKTVISREVETVAGVGFGLAVTQGADDHGVKIPDGAGQVFRGITLRDITLPVDQNDLYAQRDTAGLMTKGVVWVVADGVVAVGNPVSFDAASGALGTGGGEVIPDAVWDSSAADGELAKVRLA